MGKVKNRNIHNINNKTGANLEIKQRFKKSFFVLGYRGVGMADTGT